MIGPWCSFSVRLKKKFDCRFYCIIITSTHHTELINLAVHVRSHANWSHVASAINLRTTCSLSLKMGALHSCLPCRQNRIRQTPPHSDYSDPLRTLSFNPSADLQIFDIDHPPKMFRLPKVQHEPQFDSVCITHPLSARQHCTRCCFRSVLNR